MPDNPTPTTRLAARIRQRRADLGLTQEEFAERLSWPRSAASRLESGRSEPKLSTLCAIARALETRLGTLVDGVEIDG